MAALDRLRLFARQSRRSASRAVAARLGLPGVAGGHARRSHACHPARRAGARSGLGARQMRPTDEARRKAPGEAPLGATFGGPLETPRGTPLEPHVEPGEA